MKYDLLDISNFQDVFDLGAVYSEVECVYHHASQGTGFITPGYASRRVGAAQLGKPYGSYLFMEPGGASSQVDLFKSVVGGLSANDPRPMLDIEKPGITAVEARRAMELLSEWAGSPPFLYGGMPLLCKLAFEEPALLSAPLWFAWYPNDQSSISRILAQFTRLRLGGFATDPWEHPTLWQYSSQGQVSGIAGRVDVNKYWNGISLADVLIQPTIPPLQETEPMLIVPPWSSTGAGDTDHYRVWKFGDAAVLQGKGDCTVTEVTPNEDGFWTIALGVPYDSITGFYPKDDWSILYIGGAGWNTWEFHTDHLIQPQSAVNTEQIVDQVVDELMVDAQVAVQLRRRN